MVRLKERDWRGKRNGVCSFQFQYGTIKRLSQIRIEEKLVKFQFQYGTIKS